jgi:hypothetical protein
MSSQKPAILARRLRGGGCGRRRIAAIERAVGPHRMHDHRRLAGHRNDGLAMAGAPGNRQFPGLDLVLALKRVSNAEAAS